MQGEVIGKSEMALVRANHLRVNNYDSRIRVIKDLRTYQFTENILQDLSDLKTHTFKDVSVVNDIITYLTNSHNYIQNNLHVSEKIESSTVLVILEDIQKDIDHNLDHFNKVLATLEKEEQLPEHPTKGYVDEYYSNFKEELASSKKMVKLLEGTFWSNLINTKRSLKESSHSVSQHLKVFRDYKEIFSREQPSEKDADKIILLAETYLSRSDYDYKVLFSNLKQVFLKLKKLYSLLYVLQKFSVEEAKVVFKWNNYTLH